MTKLLWCGVLLFSFAALSMPLPAQNNSERAFATFKSLSGRWAIESNGKTLPIEMRYGGKLNGKTLPIEMRYGGKTQPPETFAAMLTSKLERGKLGKTGDRPTFSGFWLGG